MLRAIIIAALLALGSVAASGQSAQSVVTEAEDAFGERIGIERIGLYSESQVRGFSLAEAGNYRIDGAYFVRAAPLVNPVAAGVTTRVGFNALSAEFPAPSGIVDHRLRRATGNRLDVEAGFVEFGGTYVNLIGQTKSKDGRFGVAGGFVLQPYRHLASGARGKQYDVGFVPEFRISDATSLTGLVSYGTSEYWGEFLHTPTTAVLPPKLKFPSRYAASWSDWDARNFNTGLIAKTRTGPWSLQASAFYSRAHFERADYTLFTADAQGLGRGSGAFARPRTTASTSGEVKVARSLGDGHRLYGMVRARRTESHIRPSAIIDLGPSDLTKPTPPTPAPLVTNVDPTIDLVQQLTFGLGYEAKLSDRLQIRAGVQRTRYRKSVAMPGLPVNLNDESSWLYDAAAVYALSPRWTIFATATRGLEESGSAPANAVNRYQVLNAVVARQYEVGFRGRIGAGLTLIGSLFEVAKPTAGLEPSGVFSLIGEESHRGVELSLTGSILPGLTAVAGIVALEPKQAGPLVASGVQPERAMGVSSVIGVASFNYEVPFLPGLSLDGQISHNGSRLAHPTNGLETPAYELADLGGRYRFKLGEHDAVLRVFGSNIFARNEWQALRSGSLMRTAPPSVRATLTVSFD